MFLGFLRWLRESTDLDFSILLASGGDLAPAFGDIASTTLLEGPSVDASHMMRALRRVGLADAWAQPLPRNFPAVERWLREPARRRAVQELRSRAFGAGVPDVLYLNSIGAVVVMDLVPEQVRVVTHIHEQARELRLAARAWPAQVEMMLARTEVYIAASESAADALVAEFGVAPDRIQVCHEFIRIDDEPAPAGQSEQIRRDLEIPPDALVVGGMGTVEWRKGVDLFIQVAMRTRELVGDLRDRVAFTWVGGGNDEWKDRVQYDVNHAGLRDFVRFLGPMSDPKPVQELFDVFTLTSRSDTYPLVCLEAAAQATPFVCFDAGGIREFLEPADRLMVPYLDVDAMARRVAELLKSAEERRELGGRLAARVRERHRLEVGAPRLLHILESVLQHRSSVRDPG
jgi:glycosyltransferase involved in cell wall biosynthesis